MLTSSLIRVAIMKNYNATSHRITYAQFTDPALPLTVWQLGKFWKGCGKAGGMKELHAKVVLNLRCFWTCNAATLLLPLSSKNEQPKMQIILVKLSTQTKPMRWTRFMQVQLTAHLSVFGAYPSKSQWLGQLPYQDLSTIACTGLANEWDRQHSLVFTTVHCASSTENVHT